MLTRTQKEKLIKELTEKLMAARAVVFADYTGLTVVQISELRQTLRQAGATIKVAKKSLIDLALKKAGLSEAETQKMAGQIALILGDDNETAPAKISYKFSRRHDKLKILGGILNGNFIDGLSVIYLAKLPFREELLARVVGGIAAPMSGLLNVLQGNMRGLVQVLSQIDAKRRPESV